MTNPRSASGRRITIRDVADRAGVHASTVSRVLNGDDRRAVPETRERIRQAAEELGWTPNSIARSLSTGRTYALGMIIPRLANPAYTGMITGAQAIAEDNGNVLLVTDTLDDESRLEHQVERLSGRVDGFIVASARTSSAAVQSLADRGTPFVLLNRRTSGGHPAVIGDDEAGVRLALEHLINLGHTNIAHLTGQPGVDTVERRLHSYKQSMRELLGTSGKSTVRRGPLTADGVAKSAGALLDVPDEARPTAVFCVNLLTAVEFIAAAQAHGLKVPGDISVVGFDDWPLADRLDVPLTTIRMPTQTMGGTAVSLLLDRLEGRPVAAETRVPEPPELVVRRSTAKPPRRARGRS